MVGKDERPQSKPNNIQSVIVCQCDLADDLLDYPDSSALSNLQSQDTPARHKLPLQLIMSNKPLYRHGQTYSMVVDSYPYPARWEKPTSRNAPIISGSRSRKTLNVNSTVSGSIAVGDMKLPMTALIRVNT